MDLLQILLIAAFIVFCTQNNTLPAEQPRLMGDFLFKKLIIHAQLVFGYISPKQDIVWRLVKYYIFRENARAEVQFYTCGFAK